MGYALKIKGVDFSTVALDQIEYIEPIPCTGLSLNPASLTFDTAEESKQLTAIKTPSDTTDSVTWTSSDANIASVDSAGLVTIHGIGTATITATCGEQTASVTIVQSTIKAQYALKIVSGKSCYNANASDGQYIALDNNANETIIGQPYHSSNTDLLVGAGAINDVECVRVPYGATAIYIKTSDDAEVTLSYAYVATTLEMVTQGTTQYPKFLRRKDFFKTNTGYAVEHGECVLFRPGNGKDISTLDYIYFN